jgi:Holliday junction resolvase
MGKMSREKGKRGELEVAAILRRWGFDGHRGQQYHGGPDSPDVVGLPGVHIEVKRVESLRLWDALEQSTRDADQSGEIPVVFHRKNGKPWVVICTAEGFMKLYTLIATSLFESISEDDAKEIFQAELLRKLQELEGGGVDA